MTTSPAEFLDLADQLQGALDAAEPERITDLDACVRRPCTPARGEPQRRRHPRQGRRPRREAGGRGGQGDPRRGRGDGCAAADRRAVGQRARAGRAVARGRALDVAPLLRDRVLTGTPTVLTSATLKLGGEFEGVARTVGLWATERVPDGGEAPDEPTGLPWRALDVGSPFDYARQGICYIARHLPNPSRDGIGPEALAEIAELVGGRRPDARPVRLPAQRRGGRPPLPRRAAEADDPPPGETRSSPS